MYSNLVISVQNMCKGDLFKVKFAVILKNRTVIFVLWLD